MRWGRGRFLNGSCGGVYILGGAEGAGGRLKRGDALVAGSER